MKIKNATSLPDRFYGLHMAEGCAEYLRDDGSMKIFIGEKALKNMDATFQSRPVFVGHVDDVDVNTLEDTADGYVVKSFYNPADGKHWSEFMVITDKGKEAIRSGWTLSNAYHIKKSGAGGRWHGMDYEQEIIEGEYEHLAIVNDPRYEESIILTPEQFKEYNAKKQEDLIKLSNSNNKPKTKRVGMFKFFKKEKVENSSDIEGMSVILPKSKREVTLEVLVNEMDEKEMNKYCNEEDMIELENGDSISVADMKNKYKNMIEDEEKRKNEEDEKKENEDEDKKENEEDEDKKENEGDDDIEKKENEEEDDLENEEDDLENEDEDEDKKKNSFDKLKNAHLNDKNSVQVIETSEDKVARGNSRYGSN